MGAKSGVALKFLQWFVRAIQFCCSAVVLALFSYFLAALHNHNFYISTWIRAVEGISGVGVLYTLVGLLLLCCLAGHRLSSIIAIIFDVAFIAGFIYIAISNRGGASTCRGDSLDTPFGTGSANDTPQGSTDGFTNLPTYRQACQMETACLAVSIVAIFFFIFSIFLEIALVRHHRKEARFGPSPANNYTSGYGGRRGFFGLFKRRTAPTNSENPNALPAHTTPEQIRTSYNTETTAVGHESGPYNKFGEAGYHHDGHTAYPETGVTGTTHTPTHRYNDGTYNV